MALKYKEGDRVLIKDIDWYNKNKDEDGDVLCGDYEFVSYMTVFCGKILTIDVEFEDETYLMKEDTDGFVFTTEMIEGLADNIEDRMKELRKMCTISLNDSNYSDKIEVLLNNYEYVEEDGKVYFVKKKKEVTYPKTYEECCEIIHSDPKFYVDTHLYSGTLDALYKLLICRDAYWKIAGEEMGLGKPWKPDWDAKDNHFYTIYTFNGKIECAATAHRNAVLIFPTEEMRDAFKENFDPDIEICKELL